MRLRFYNVSMDAPSSNNVAPPRNSTPAEVLATPVSRVREVGLQWVPLLDKLGIRTAADLLFFFPRDYEDLSDRRAIADLQEEKIQTVRGRVVEVDGQSSGFGKSRVGVLVRDDTDSIRAIWFNQPFMRRKFRVGQHVLMSAKPRFHSGRWEMAHPRIS